MRHRKRTAKLGMKSQHRRATLASLVCSLIKHSRITTTVARAKEARRFADRMVTLAKKGSLHHRRQARAFLHENSVVAKLFAEIGKQHADRQGGYTRLIRIGARQGDAAEMALLEWTGTTVAAAPVAEATESAGKKEAKPKASKKTKATKSEPKKAEAAKE